jgi:hypothetical protein
MATLNEKFWSSYRETIENVSRDALANVDFVAAVFDRRLDRPDVVPSRRRRATLSPKSSRRTVSR